MLRSRRNCIFCWACWALAADTVHRCRWRFTEQQQSSQPPPSLPPWLRFSFSAPPSLPLSLSPSLSQSGSFSTLSAAPAYLSIAPVSYLYISPALSFITMRLGVCSFISDILSTPSNICFCWTEGKVESNLLHLHHPLLLWSKAAAGLKASGVVLYSYLITLRSTGLWCEAECVSGCRNMSWMSHFGWRSCIMYDGLGWVAIITWSSVQCVRLWRWLCFGRAFLMCWQRKSSFLVQRLLGLWHLHLKQIPWESHWKRNAEKILYNCWKFDFPWVANWRCHWTDHCVETRPTFKTQTQKKDTNTWHTCHTYCTNTWTDWSISADCMSCEWRPPCISQKIQTWTNYSSGDKNRFECVQCCMYELSLAKGVEAGGNALCMYVVNTVD